MRWLFAVAFLCQTAVADAEHFKFHQAQFSKPAFSFLNLNILNCRPFGPEDDLAGSHESYDQFTKRLDGIIAKMRELDPDFMSLQEITNCWFFKERKWIEIAPIIARGTGMQYMFWQSEGVSGMWEEGIAFYWKPDRINFDGLACNHLQDIHYMGPFKIVKSLCRGKITLADGRSFSIYQTHLDTKRRHSEPQTEEILRIIGRDENKNTPILFSGDFNNLVNEPGISMIEDAGFKRLISDHVDHIFLRNMPEASARVLPFYNWRLSDHNGFFLEIPALNQEPERAF